MYFLNIFLLVYGCVFVSCHEFMAFACKEFSLSTSKLSPFLSKKILRLPLLRSASQENGNSNLISDVNKL